VSQSPIPTPSRIEKFYLTCFSAYLQLPTTPCIKFHSSNPTYLPLPTLTCNHIMKLNLQVHILSNISKENRNTTGPRLSIHDTPLSHPTATYTTTFDAISKPQQYSRSLYSPSFLIVPPLNAGTPFSLYSFSSIELTREATLWRRIDSWVLDQGGRW